MIPLHLMAPTFALVQLATKAPIVRLILMSVKIQVPLVSMEALASTHLDHSSATVLLALLVLAVKLTSTNVTQTRVKMKEPALMSVDRIDAFACLVSYNFLNFI